MEEKVGYIYILTNPSFKEYVKIGYADDVQQRLNQLNNSECIPYAFRLYATYKVKSRLADKIVHRIIDSINSNLRTKEIYNGKLRTREFYEMSAEAVYELFENIAELSDTMGNLTKIAPNQEEKEDEKHAEKVKKMYIRTRKKLNFSEYGIPLGAELEYVKDNSIKCKVVSETKVEYQGKKYSLSALAGKLNIESGSKNKFLSGTLMFSYKGEVIGSELRNRLGI